MARRMSAAAPRDAAPTPVASAAATYEHLSKDELVRLLRRRDAERKLGLVWERPPREAESRLNEDFVGLELDPKLSVGDGPFEHLVIEGDNYDALRALRVTHKGAVRVILIDPPYNTGNRDFIYNDRYIDKEHAYRHSLWLEFMYQRLVLARELLRDDGVILVCIGEEEHARLSLLMEQVFPEMKVGSFVWRTREGGNDAQRDGAFFSQDHEYVLCFAGPKFRFGGQEKNTGHYDNPDHDPRGKWYPGDMTTPKDWHAVPKSAYAIHDPTTDVWYPPNPDRVWAYAAQKNLRRNQKLKAPTIEALIADQRVLFPKNDRTVTYKSRRQMDAAIAAGEAPSVLRKGLPWLDELVGKRLGYGRPQLKRFLSDARTLTKPLSSWILASSAKDNERDAAPTASYVMEASTTREASKSLRTMLGAKKFDYPKPVSLMKELLRQSTEVGGRDLVLDFFAGSGTTGQAVMELNDEDGGGRRVILVSSTEATTDAPDVNICRDVLRERLKRVIEGYAVRGKKNTRTVPGLPTSFAYLRARRLPMHTVSESLEHRWVWTALQMLHADAVAAFASKASIQHCAMEGLDLVYVPETTAEALRAIADLLKARRSAVIYAWTPGPLQQRFVHAGVTIRKIPDELVRRFGARGGARG